MRKRLHAARMDLPEGVWTVVPTSGSRGLSHGLFHPSRQFHLVRGNPLTAFPILLFGVVCCRFIGAALPVRGADVAAPPKEVVLLCELGEMNVQRLAELPATWTAVHQSPRGPVRVKVLHTAEAKRYDFEAGHNSGARTSLIIRDGIWYVMDERRLVKSRPFEATFSIPFAYPCLLRSEVNFLRRPDELPLTFETNRENVSVFQVGSDAAKGQGNRLFVERTTGLVLRSGAPGAEVVIEGFQWFPENVDRLLSISGKRWRDLTSPPDTSELSECALVAHAADWQPGGNASDGAHLWNLRSGEIRRLPYLGGHARPGCFLGVRSRVIVVAATSDSESRLVEIDLLTRTNRVLGGDALAGGILSEPVLSPSGDLVAAWIASNPDSRQLVILELSSDTIRRIGSPMSGTALNWLPGGNGLIFQRLAGRLTRTPDQLCRIDLDGKLTELRPGRAPLVTYRHRRVLFREVDSDLWFTCDPDGRNPERYCDGLASFRSPTFSPGEDRVIFLRFEADRSPAPFVFRYGERDGRPAPASVGVFETPIWR